MQLVVLKIGLAGAQLAFQRVDWFGKKTVCWFIFLWLYVWQVFDKPVCWFIFMAVSGFFGRSLRNQCVGLFLWQCLCFSWQVFEKPVCCFIFMAVSLAGL